MAKMSTNKLQATPDFMPTKAQKEWITKLSMPGASMVTFHSRRVSSLDWRAHGVYFYYSRSKIMERSPASNFIKRMELAGLLEWQEIEIWQEPKKEYKKSQAVLTKMAKQYLKNQHGHSNSRHHLDRHRVKPTKHSFQMCRDEQGKVIPGLWASEICRVERIDGLWRAEVPMRAIGQSRFCEFRPIDMDGQWQSIYSYRVREDAMLVAERLKSGVWVWQKPCFDEFGRVLGRLVKFADVVGEITATQ